MRRWVSTTAASRAPSCLTDAATAASADSSCVSCCSTLASIRSSASPAALAPPLPRLVSAPTRARLAASTAPRVSSSPGSSWTGPAGDAGVAPATDGMKTRPATAHAVAQRRPWRRASPTPAPILERDGNKRRAGRSVVGAGGVGQRVRVHRLPTTGVELEVQVRGAVRGVPAGAPLARPRPRRHVARPLVGVPLQVRAVVGVAVVAVDVPAQPAQARAPVLHPAADGRHGRRAAPGHHGDALVLPAGRTGGTPRVGELHGALDRADDPPTRRERSGGVGGGLRLGLSPGLFLAPGFLQPGQCLGVFLGGPQLVEPAALLGRAC